MYAELRGEYDHPAQHPVFEPTGSEWIAVAGSVATLFFGLLLLLV